MKHTLILFLISGLLLSDPFAAPLRAQTVKGKSIRTHKLKLEKKKSKQTTDSIPSVCFLSERPPVLSSEAIQKAFGFLSGQKQFSVEYKSFRDIEKSRSALSPYRIVWIHRPDTSSFTENEPGPKAIAALREYLNQGGNLLLTQQAFHYINILGLETVQPRDSSKSCIDEGYGRKLGFHAFREHPLFEGMNGGAYIQRPGRDLSTRITGFFGNNIPLKGKVIGIDWDYIFIREDSKLILEYENGKGKVIAVGGYIDFTEPNLNRLHLELFTRNCLDYLSGKFAGAKEYYWDYNKNTVSEGIAALSESGPPPVMGKSTIWMIPEDALAMGKRYASHDYFDEAGKRILLMGEEISGIEEIWAHPFMALRDYEAGIKFGYRDTTYLLADERPEIEVHPGFLVRTYRFPRAYLKEIIVADPEEAGALIHYEYHGVYEAELSIKFRSNLRWMWPYSERVTGGIVYQWDSTLRAFVIRDRSGDLNVLLGSSRRPVEKICGQFSSIAGGEKGKPFTGIPEENFRVTGGLRYALAATDILDIVVAATSEGFEKSSERYRRILADPQKVFTDNAEEVSRIFSKRLMITTPDQNFNKGYRWALFATDRFMVNTPGMGTALVAGYSTTRRGWDGGHKVNGRPGYGWYFGRDGEWSGLAMNNCGDYGDVKKELEFLNKYQDLTGKIFHEATTSGFIHYDASDATPLYILLAGRYFRFSNDTAFIRKSWPNIRRAIDFCFSTDTDKDHLIENTNVGHGWVEGGELYGSHATLYMAGCWAAALSEAANMARFTGDPGAESFAAESAAVKKIINTDFWNPKKNFYSYGKNRDGSFRSDPTVLPAVPLSFRLADRDKAVPVLRQYGSNAFSTNWGTRIIRDDSPWFNPRGYHYGSVWPLFTGWTSMAEFAYGNYQQGFTHIMNNLNVYKSWGLGYVEEVLNGSEYKPSGVCPHQCWSETMVLQPAVEGMLGLDINARENKISLSPRIPADWDSLRVEHIQIGDRSCNLLFRRSEGLYSYIFQIDGTGAEVDFMPVLPAGAVATQARINGKETPFASFSTRQYTSLSVKFRIEANTTVEILTERGISVLPFVPDIRPGDPAPGLRILSTNLTGREYTIDLEGEAGTDGEIRLYCSGDLEIERIENGKSAGQTDNILSVRVDFPPGKEKYSLSTVKIILK